MTVTSPSLKTIMQQCCGAECCDDQATKALEKHCETWLQGWDATADALNPHPEPQEQTTPAAPCSLVTPLEGVTMDKRLIRLKKGDVQNNGMCAKLTAAAHRQRLDPSVFPAMVTRMVSRRELSWNEEAATTLRKELLNLAIKCWGEHQRRSRADVIAEALQQGRLVKFSGVH